MNRGEAGGPVARRQLPRSLARRGAVGRLAGFAFRRLLGNVRVGAELRGGGPITRSRAGVDRPDAVVSVAPTRAIGIPPFSWSPWLAANRRRSGRPAPPRHRRRHPRNDLGHRGRVDAAVEVTGIEQGDPDLARRAAQGPPAHRVGIVVMPAAGCVVEVMNPRPRDPGLRHLGEGGRRQGQVAVRVKVRQGAAYICRRQVQKSPWPEWVRPRRIRWKACEWTLAKPGTVRPGSRSASPAGPGAGLRPRRFCRPRSRS